MSSASSKAATHEGLGARPVRTMRHPIRYRIEAALAVVGFAVLRLLPVDWVSGFGGWLTRTIGPLTSATKTAQQNVKAALPDLNDQDRQTVIKGVYDNFGRSMAEYAVLKRLWRDGATDRIELVGAEPLKVLADSGTPAILFTGHIANWEIPPLVIAKAAKPMATVYRPPNNPLIEDLIAEARGDMAADLIPKGSSGSRDLIRVLKSGGHVAIVVDQKMNTGLPIPFFGRDAMTGDAVARLARKFNAPLLGVHTERLGGCRFRVTIEEPWFVDNTEDADTDVRNALVQINETLERWIRARPDQWLWLHNRWPKDPS